MSRGELREALSSMPPGLDHAYKRDLQRISKLSKDQQNQAKTILRWMLFAVQPLSVKELFHVLAVKDGHNAPLKDNIPDPIDEDCIQRILRLCGSLVEVQAETRQRVFGPRTHLACDSTIHFVHFSAKEFLLNARDECEHLGLADFFFPTPEEHHRVITRSCLSYLLLSSGTPQAMEQVNYPAKKWMTHFELSTTSSKLESMSFQRELFTPGPSFDRWMRTIGFQGTTPLAAACTFGLVDICRELLKRPGNNPNQLIGRSGTTALHYAVSRGYEAVVRELLAREDVDVNCEDNKGRTPLHRAADHGHGGVVQQLLARKGVDVNRAHNNGKTPLHRAADRGHDRVVQQLLKRVDVNVNRTDKEGRTPLFVASLNGHEPVVQLLLMRKGVEVNRRDNMGRSPLSVAAWKGCEAVVRQLLMRGDVEVNCKDNSGCTPCSMAAAAGHEGVVQRLLVRRGNSVFGDSQVGPPRRWTWV